MRIKHAKIKDIRTLQEIQRVDNPLKKLTYEKFKYFIDKSKIAKVLLQEKNNKIVGYIIYLIYPHNIRIHTWIFKNIPKETNKLFDALQKKYRLPIRFFIVKSKKLIKNSYGFNYGFKKQALSKDPSNNKKILLVREYVEKKTKGKPHAKRK